MELKSADLLVANDVTEPGAGFDTDTNPRRCARPGQEPQEVPMAGKRAVERQFSTPNLGARLTPRRRRLAALLLASSMRGTAE